MFSKQLREVTEISSTNNDLSYLVGQIRISKKMLFAGYSPDLSHPVATQLLGLEVLF